MWCQRRTACHTRAPFGWCSSKKRPLNSFDCMHHTCMPGHAAATCTPIAAAHGSTAVLQVGAVHYCFVLDHEHAGHGELQ
jgi:hypothetical protein